MFRKSISLICLYAFLAASCSTGSSSNGDKKQGPKTGAKVAPYAGAWVAIRRGALDANVRTGVVQRHWAKFQGALKGSIYKDPKAAIGHSDCRYCGEEISGGIALAENVLAMPYQMWKTHFEGFYNRISKKSKTAASALRPVVLPAHVAMVATMLSSNPLGLTKAQFAKLKAGVGRNEVAFIRWPTVGHAKAYYEEDETGGPLSVPNGSAPSGGIPSPSCNPKKGYVTVPVGGDLIHGTRSTWSRQLSSLTSGNQAALPAMAQFFGRWDFSLHDHVYVTERFEKFLTGKGHEAEKAGIVGAILYIISQLGWKAVFLLVDGREPSSQQQVIAQVAKEVGIPLSDIESAIAHVGGPQAFAPSSPSMTVAWSL